MSNSELSTEYRQSIEALPSSESGSDRSDLKIILDAIAAQLSDADRRHSATLIEMQDRIAGMERETEITSPSCPSAVRARIRAHRDRRGGTRSAPF